MTADRCSLLGCYRLTAAGSHRCLKHGDVTLTIVRYYPDPDEASADQTVLEKYGIRTVMTLTFVEGHKEWEVAAAIPLRPHLARVIDPEPDEMTRGMSTLWDDD